jgi:MFS family permease
MSATPPPLNFPRGWTAIQVNSHLHTLKILFYVLGALQVVMALFMLFAALAAFAGEGGDPDKAATQAMMAVFFACFGVAMAAFGTLSIVAGRRLAARQQHLLCKVAAGAACLCGLLGIALGVYAFIVLLRPEVKAEFFPAGSTVAA